MNADYVFFVVLPENIRVAGARAHFMRLYILFNSFQFNSFHFYSIQRDEKNETLRMITNDNEKKENYENYENYEILRKKGNTLRKNHVFVIFYAKTVYFFIHLKNKTIAFFLFFVHFRYYSLFVNYDFFTK